jgi:hypothetical protein
MARKFLKKMAGKLIETLQEDEENPVSRPKRGGGRRRGPKRSTTTKKLELMDDQVFEQGILKGEVSLYY